jgi:hypothetical protein
VSAKPTLVSLILDATAAGRAMLTAASAAAQKTLLSLTKSDVGLPNVDNTSDANKPVSTAQQAEIDSKIGGTVGTTANRILRSSGTGGLTLQASGITVDDSNNVSGVSTLAVTAPVAMSLGTSVINGAQPGLNCASGNLYIGSVNSTLWLCSGNSNRWQVDSSGNFLANGARTLTTTGAINGADITASGLLCAGVYTFATVPSASSNSGKFLRISDREQRHAYSDGTNWRFFVDDAVIS